MNRLDPPIAISLLDGLRRFHRLKWWLDGDGHPTVTLSLPPGHELKLDARRAHCKWDGSTITYEETSARWDNPRRLDRLAAALEGLPDGTRLKLDTGEGYAFEGAVAAGLWTVDRCSSPVSSAVLGRALELSRQCDEESYLEAWSPELAEAAGRGIEANWSGVAAGYQIQGSRILVDDPDENRSCLTLFAAEVFMVTPEFQQAFPGLEETLREREAEVQAWQSAVSQLSGSLNQHMGLKIGELLHKGKKGKFYRSDVASVNWVVPADLELADAEFARLGFRPVGDLTADTLVGALMRGYCRPGGRAWGAVTLGISGEFIREFVSHCQDDTHLTTTSLPESDARPERKVLKQSLPEQDVAGLLAAHEAELERLGLEPDPADGDLIDLCKVVDHFLTRWM